MKGGHMAAQIALIFFALAGFGFPPEALSLDKLPTISEMCQKASQAKPPPDMKPEVARLTNPIDCFVTVTEFVLSTCQITSSLQLENARLAAETARLSGVEPPPAKPMMQCIEQGESGAEGAYHAALARIGKHAARANAAKDYYASWRAAMDGIRPAFQEIVIDYKRRQAASAASVQQKGELLKLE